MRMNLKHQMWHGHSARAEGSANEGPLNCRRSPARAGRPCHWIASPCHVGWIAIIALMMGLWWAERARGDVFVEQSIPQRWVRQFQPEELPELTHPAWFDELDKARAEAFRGRYRKALMTLHGAEDADPVEAALVKGQALLALGRHERAMAALSDESVADEPRVQVLRARALTETGRDKEAIALLRAHLEAHPDSMPGHYYLGAISEEMGDLETARQAFGWFVEEQRVLDQWQGRSRPFDDAAEVVLIGRALDRWATLSGAYQNNRHLHNIILGMFTRAYDVIDREYWPARVAAAEYMLSHDDAEGAIEELEAALESNPNDPRSQEMLGFIALGRFNFDGVDAMVRAIRKVNPRSIRADLLETRNLLLQRRPYLAEETVREVLQHQPHNIEALGLYAAVHALQLRDERAAEVLGQIDELAPEDARGYYEVAEQLAAMRQYPRAEAMYQVAIERAPWWTQPRNGLGLLYTQSGDEDAAMATLDAAHALDPFNLRTTNYLRLLDDMARFERLETENFIILYDAEADPIIPKYFGDYLESIHDEVCELFEHTPDRKTLIEVFPTHDRFSVRTTGSPWIGTVGASTGPVIALVAPRKGENTMGAFHWAQVLRHEFVHTVTLSATENRIAHWMTEGLAVMEEGVPLRWEWVPMLYHAVTKDELFTLEELTWGFIRPRRPMDRTLAYAQSYWVCEFIQERHGRKALLEMMDGFRRGLREEEVFQQVLGQSRSEFTEAFFEWARREVDGWGYDEEASNQYSELREKAEGLVRARQYAEALPVWREIVELRPVDALPHQRLAGLYLTPQVNQPENAIEHLARLHQVELKDNRYAKRIARLYRDMGRVEDAATYGKEAVYIDPYDIDAHELLAELYEATGDEQGLERERRAVEVLREWHAEQRRRSLLPGAPES
jgi:cellulose synthase operon protein C